MKNIILNLLFLLELRASLTLDYTHQADFFTAALNPCNDIRNGQFICEDCGTLSFCLQQNNAWTTLKVTECQTQHNLYCDEEARGCVFKQNCKESTRGPKFECQNSGIFPDPYDCKYYHICDKKNEGERLSCPNGSAYSPASKTCSLETNTDVCLEAQYECNHLGQVAAWPTDPSIYYVCSATFFAGKQVHYPVLYRCQSGYVFVKNKCAPYTLPTEASPPAPIAKPEFRTCRPGSDLIPNPDDSNSYFICVNRVLVSTMCPRGTYFSPSLKSCVF